MNDAYTQARNIALQLLRNDEIVSSKRVIEVTKSVLMMIAATYPDEHVDAGVLQREIEGLCNVWVPSGKMLDGDEDHVVWLGARSDQIDWNFWERYERYLESEKGWAPAQVRRLGEVTSDLLGRFEDPTRDGKWDRRGMVVGQVQSGKTANYTGLICKAADAGYRLIVVLAGLHNSLRSQTQQRLDREFLGFDTQNRLTFDQSNRRVGVGAMKGRFLHAHSLTSSAERGDFQKKVADQVWVQAGGHDPILLVVKKNASVLRNLYNWATDVQRETDPGTGRPIVRGVPLLVIDDEADNASVNTKLRPLDDNGQPVDDYDPTKINGRIRQLLQTFEKSAYLAYTATPFANIFIDEDEDTATYGEDLFPRSFIVSLRPPSNYTGVARVFGLDEDVTAGIDVQPGLPIVRRLDDHQGWLPDKHNKELVPGNLPASLMEAVNAFLLACASRRARGQNDHNTMLVHVTRFTAVQAHVRRSLEDHVTLMRGRMRYSSEERNQSPWSALQDLWERDFTRTTNALRADPGLVLDVGNELSWQQVRAHLPAVLEDLELRTMNGTSEDSLTYTESDRPLTLIAVGGDKLSRGLTLEGLTVSYYLRASKMYDTLMQMGRWFGYRPGYLDVCRLYTTTELADWYRDIAVANEELLREFDYMVSLGKTPKDYGLRVRAHPDGLMITAAAKMRHGREVDVTFSQTISESISFDTDQKTLAGNLTAAERMVRELGEPWRAGELTTAVWSDVPPSEILRFLDSYRTPDTATKARPAALAEYVRALTSADLPELTSWTVGLISVEASSRRFAIGGLNLGLVERAPHLPNLDPDQRAEAEKRFEAGKDRYVIRRLVSPTDEMLDLSSEQIEEARTSTISAWKRDPKPRSKTEPTRPSGLQIREVRGSGRGLLLLYPLMWRDWMVTDLPPVGFAVSFPRSISAKKIKYRVNNLWWDLEFGDVGDDE